MLKRTVGSRTAYGIFWTKLSSMLNHSILTRCNDGKHLRKQILFPEKLQIAEGNLDQKERNPNLPTTPRTAVPQENREFYQLNPLAPSIASHSQNQVN